jgi:hypothetical protein
VAVLTSYLLVWYLGKRYIGNESPPVEQCIAQI